jgi:hypothetical protein
MPLSDTPVTSRLDLEGSARAYRAFSLQIVNLAGSALTGWSAGDVLAVEVWRGDETEALDDAGITAAWSNANNGLITIATTGAHEIPASSYQWRLLATSGGLTYEVCRGSYTLKPAPGDSASCLPVSQRPYTTIEDLRTVAPWIDQCKSEYDRTGFEEHQITARLWLDNVVMRSHNDRYTFSRYTSAYGQYWGTRHDEPPDWLKTSIESGKGIELTPALRRACALYACHLICMAQVSMKEDSSAYRRKAAEFRAMANSALTAATVKVKSYATSQKYDVVINLNVCVRN